MLSSAFYIFASFLTNSWHFRFCQWFVWLYATICQSYRTRTRGIASVIGKGRVPFSITRISIILAAIPSPHTLWFWLISLG